MNRSSLRSAVLATILCGVASAAFAHAPLPRAVAVSNEGALAVRMPGFGWLIRGADDAAFGYACDALFGVRPIEEHAPMAYRGDGALLVGTARGVRIVSSGGCPMGPAKLEGLTIKALAVHGDVAYAIAAGADQPPVLHHSDDGGESWQARATFEASPAVGPGFALVFAASAPQTVYVSRSLGGGLSEVSVSIDGGASFETLAQERDVTLVAVQASPARLWATARIPGQGVGVHVLRAEQASGPWAEVLELNFFGGLAIDPQDADVVWVGDEARGVFRSDDGGASFTETQPDISSASLAYGDGALWSCTPNLPERPALMRSLDALEPFASEMAFRDVTELVSCAPPIDVAQTCAPAWIEWRRDVLAIPVEDLLDAGSQDDAGVMADADVADAAVPDAAVPDAAVTPAPARRDSSSCSVRASKPSSPAAWLALAAAIALRALRRRRRDCALPACPRTAAHPRATPTAPATTPRSS